MPNNTHVYIEGMGSENTWNRYSSLRGSVVLIPMLYRIPFKINSSVMTLYSEVWLRTSMKQERVYVM